jgi:hypothetical protein
MGSRAAYLKVLDGQTLCYADFRGDRQYISVGNLQGNESVRLLSDPADPEFSATLRGWNCPQHIAPKFSEAEVAELKEQAKAAGPATAAGLS